MKTRFEIILRDASLPISVRIEDGLFAIYLSDRRWFLARDSVHAAKEYCALRTALLASDIPPYFFNRGD